MIVVPVDNWKRRRLRLDIALAVMTVDLQYIVFKGVDTPLNQQLSLALIGGIVGLITAYVFGATWDDKNKKVDP